MTLARVDPVPDLSANGRRLTAQSTLETYDSIHPDESMTLLFLSEEGRKALRILHEQGACRDLHPEIFYPTKGKSATPAYAVCDGCPVQVECLTFALRTTEREGIWGSTNERDRRPLLRRVARGEAPDEVAAGYLPHRRCPAVGQKGEPCGNWTKEGSLFCARHQPTIDTPEDVTATGPAPSTGDGRVA